MAIMEALGPIFSTVGAMSQQQSSNSAASNANAFTERMSNTSYQRAVADLNAAGLSPMLAYERGGASTPTGAMSQTAQMGIGEAAIGSQGAANQSRQVDVADKVANSSVELNSAQADRASAEADLIRAQTPLTPEEIKSRTTLNYSSAGAQDQLVKESAKRIEEIGSRLETAGVEREHLRAVIENLASQNRLNAQHINLMSVQMAAEKANIKLTTNQAMTVASTLPAILSNYAAMTARTKQETNIHAPDESFAGGVGGAAKPWVSLVGDALGAVGSTVGGALGGFLGSRRGSTTNINSASSSAPNLRY